MSRWKNIHGDSIFKSSGFSDLNNFVNTVGDY